MAKVQIYKMRDSLLFLLINYVIFEYNLLIMRYILVAVNILFVFSVLFSQPQSCDGVRYREARFDSVQVTTIKYGENINNIGATIELYMDIHEPFGDQADVRPLMILAHGGSFVSGTRNDMSALCDAIASMGYVCATIDYRLAFFFQIPDSTALLDVVAKAIGDFKAANRYFLKDADTENRFRIDTGFVVYGGVSAGAITAVNAAYLDSTDSLPNYLQSIFDQNGGLEGNTGDTTNQSYQARAHAVFNLSGAIYRSDWIDDGEAPIYSYHGDADETVPFGAGHVSFLGNPIVSLKGSSVIHDRADSVGLINRLLAVPSGGHTDIYDPEGLYSDSLEILVEEFPNFMADLYCSPLTAIQQLSGQEQIKIYPNPTSGLLYLDRLGVDRLGYQLFNVSGALVQSGNVRGPSISIDKKMTRGFYILRLFDLSSGYRFLSQRIILTD